MASIAPFVRPDVTEPLVQRVVHADGGRGGDPNADDHRNRGMGLRSDRVTTGPRNDAPFEHGRPKYGAHHECQTPIAAARVAEGGGVTDRTFVKLPGEGYALTAEGVRLEFRYLRRDHHQLHAE